MTIIPVVTTSTVTAQPKTKAKSKSNQTNTDDMWLVAPVSELTVGVAHHIYRANDPYLNLKKNVAYIRQHLRIQVACGTAEPDHLTTVREYHAALTELAVPHEYFEVEGLDHNQKTMIDGRKEHWFDFHIESLKLAGAPLHYVE